MNNHHSNMRLTTSDAQCKSIKKGDVFRLFFLGNRESETQFLALSDAKVSFLNSKRLRLREEPPSIQITIHIFPIGTIKANQYIVDRTHKKNDKIGYGYRMIFFSCHGTLESPIAIDVIAQIVSSGETT